MTKIKLRFNRTISFKHNRNTINQNLEVGISTIRALLGIRKARFTINTKAIMIMRTVHRITQLLHLRGRHTNLSNISNAKVGLRGITLISQRRIRRIIPTTIFSRLYDLNTILNTLTSSSYNTKLTIRRMPTLNLTRTTILILNNMLIIKVSLSQGVILNIRSLGRRQRLFTLTITGRLTILNPRPQRHITNMQTLHGLTITIKVY